MIFGRKPLSGKATFGVIVFTVIETIVLTVWLMFALQKNVVGAVLSLLVGLFVEHFIATQVGQQDQ